MIISDIWNISTIISWILAGVIWLIWHPDFSVRERSRSVAMETRDNLNWDHKSDEIYDWEKHQLRYGKCVAWHAKCSRLLTKYGVLNISTGLNQGKCYHLKNVKSFWRTMTRYNSCVMIANICCQFRYCLRHFCLNPWCAESILNSIQWRPFIARFIIANIL